jgi:Leucine-rich repeat (LRR) protein
MKLRILLIFTSIFIASSSAQTASCEFSYTFVNAEEVYACILTLDNPEGLEITEIEGWNHELGLTDDDVVGISYQSGTVNFVPPAICERFVNVERIDLFESGLSIITDESFAACGELTSLIMFGNQLTSITAGAFVNNAKLESLDISNTTLTSLPDGIFDTLMNLKTLVIHHNPFADFPAAIFHRLEALEVLFMENTELSHVNNEWFINNRNLIDLWLFTNHISNVTEPVFAGLTSLQNLNFNDNQLNVFNCEGLTSLTHLNLESNRFTEITDATIIGMSSLARLEFINLSYNNIATIPTGAFRSLTSLTFLNMGFANIQRLESGAFEGLTNLVTITLNDNNIADLPMGIFAMSSRFTSITVSGNKLRVIRRSAFASALSLLIQLYLNQNEVVAIDDDFFTDATSLNYLNLHDNVCEDDSFINFVNDKGWVLEQLDGCFQNFELTAGEMVLNGLYFGLFFCDLKFLQFHLLNQPFYHLESPKIPKIFHLTLRGFHAQHIWLPLPACHRTRH